MAGKTCEAMSRGELLTEVRRLMARAREFEKLRGAVHELEVHREELRTQQDALLETQQLLETSRDRYADLFDFAPIAHVIVDSHGIVQDINLTGVSVLNERRDRLVGIPFFTFVAEAERRPFLDFLARCRRADTPLELDVTLQTRSGRTVPAHVKSKPCAGVDASTCSFQLAIVDLTERRQAEEARRRAEEEQRRMAQEEQLARAASDAKDQFIATLSHELRTPLTPILFALKAAEQRGSLPNWIAPTFDLIRRNVEQEARLIDDLLDVTRISRGKLTLAREPVDVHAVLDDVASQCAEEMRTAGLALTQELAASAYHVHADPTRLRQVFWNLLNNARQHTPSGGRISLRTSNDAEGALVVVVADSGEGIEPAVLSRLFAPYAQAPAKGRRPAGLGLGLAICKAIVEAHGGQIWAHSEGPATGAAFTMRLPTLPMPERKASRPSAKRARAPASKTVLLVEDDKHTAAAIAEVLRLSGYEVKRARTISEGLQQAGEGFDVLVCDIGLPDGSGRDLIRELLASRPVRAIALTGYGMEPDVRGNIEAGFARHLTKPIDPEELLAAVGELLETQPVPVS